MLARRRLQSLRQHFQFHLNEMVFLLVIISNVSLKVKILAPFRIVKDRLRQTANPDKISMKSQLKLSVSVGCVLRIVDVLIVS